MTDISGRACSHERRAARGHDGAAGAPRARAHWHVPLAIAVAGLLTLAGAAPALAKGQWRLGGAALTESVATESQGTMKLSATKILGEHRIAVECKYTTSGLAKVPSETSYVTSWTGSSCVVVAPTTYCTQGSAAKVTAVNLSWGSEVLTVEGTTRDVLTHLFGEEGSQIGFAVVCTGSSGEVKFQCTKHALEPQTTNSSGGVSATFVEEKLTCTDGNEPGTLEGSQTITASKGGTLSAASAEEVTKLSEAQWRRNGLALTEETHTSWGGEISFRDSHYSGGHTFAVERCHVEGEGSVKPSDQGEVKYWTAHCEEPNDEGVCRSHIKMSALHLPWHTELVDIGGSAHEVLVGSGIGLPGYRVECFNGTETITDECLGPIVAKAADVTGEVSLAYEAGEKLKCTYNTAPEGVLGRTSDIRISGATLEVVV